MAMWLEQDPYSSPGVVADGPEELSDDCSDANSISHPAQHMCNLACENLTRMVGEVGWWQEYDCSHLKDDMRAGVLICALVIPNALVPIKAECSNVCVIEHCGWDRCVRSFFGCLHTSGCMLQWHLCASFFLAIAQTQSFLQHCCHASYWELSSTLWIR